MSIDLAENLLVEQGLSKNLNRLVFLADTQFLRLLVNLDGTGVTILLRPTPQLRIRAVGVLVTVVIPERQS